MLVDAVQREGLVGDVCDGAFQEAFRHGRSKISGEAHHTAATTRGPRHFHSSPESLSIPQQIC